jgi:O-antigen ligase
MSTTMTFLVAVPALLAATYFAVAHLENFVLVVLPVAMIFPPAIVQPAGVIVALADLLTVVALGAWIVSNAVTGRPRAWIGGNTLLAVAVVFWGLNVASLAWTVDVGDTIKLSLQILELVVLTLLLFSSIASHERAVRTGLLAFCGATVLLGLAAVAAVVANIGAGSIEALELPGGLNKNVTGTFTAAGFAVAFVYFLTATRARQMSVYGLASLLLLVATTMTVSRGSVLGLVVAAISATLLLRRHRLTTLGLVTAVVIAFLAAFGTDSRLTDEGRRSGSYDSAELRLRTYRDAIAKIEERPLLGSGAGTYEVYFPDIDVGLPDPNNTVLLTWAELGVSGLAALLLLYGVVVRQLLVTRTLPAQARTTAIAAGCVGVSVLVHFQFDVTWTRGTAQLAFASLGMMAGLARAAPSPLSKHLARDLPSFERRPRLEKAGAR